MQLQVVVDDRKRFINVFIDMSRSRDVISWACECEQWTHEREQVSPSEHFQEYPTNINKILLDTWDKIFGDVEEYSTTCHGWTIFLDDGLTFIKDGQTHEKSWMTQLFTRKRWNNFTLVLFWKIQHTKC